MAEPGQIKLRFWFHQSRPGSWSVWLSADGNVWKYGQNHSMGIWPELKKKGIFHYVFSFSKWRNLNKQHWNAHSTNSDPASSLSIRYLDIYSTESLNANQTISIEREKISSRLLVFKMAVIPPITSFNLPFGWSIRCLRGSNRGSLNGNLAWTKGTNFSINFFVSKVAAQSITQDWNPNSINDEFRFNSWSVYSLFVTLQIHERGTYHSMGIFNLNRLRKISSYFSSFRFQNDRTNNTEMFILSTQTRLLICLFVIWTSIPPNHPKGIEWLLIE